MDFNTKYVHCCTYRTPTLLPLYGTVPYEDIHLKNLEDQSVTCEVCRFTYRVDFAWPDGNNRQASKQAATGQQPGGVVASRQLPVANCQQQIINACGTSVQTAITIRRR